MRLCDSRSVMREGRLGWSAIARSIGVGPAVRLEMVGVTAAVVVEDDDGALARVTDVVQRLISHPAGHRTIADHRDDVPMVVSAGYHATANP